MWCLRRALAVWASEHRVGLLAWLGAGPTAAVVASLVGLDAAAYLWHRANHRLPLLWRNHRVHHADACFHVTTALRFHPGELLLALPVRLAAILALGVPPAGVLLFELVFGVANLLVHENFDLPRRLETLARRLFVTPALHRTHHACDWRELDTNFGTVFSTGDRLAGSFRASAPDRRVRTGLPTWSRPEPPSLGPSLLLPFADGQRLARRARERDLVALRALEAGERVLSASSERRPSAPWLGLASDRSPSSTVSGKRGPRASRAVELRRAPAGLPRLAPHPTAAQNLRRGPAPAAPDPRVRTGAAGQRRRVPSRRGSARTYASSTSSVASKRPTARSASAASIRGCR